MNGLIRFIGVDPFNIWILLLFVWLDFRQIQQILNHICISIAYRGPDHSSPERECAIPFQIPEMRKTHAKQLRRLLLVNQFRQNIRNQLSFLRQMTQVCHQFIIFRLRNDSAFHNRRKKASDKFNR